MNPQNAFLGIDVGSISTKAVIIDEHNTILAQEYIWTEGNPIGAVKKLLGLLEKQLDRDAWQITGVGATGSARRLVGSIVGATVVKNELSEQPPSIRMSGPFWRSAGRIQRSSWWKTASPSITR